MEGLMADRITKRELIDERRFFSINACDPRYRKLLKRADRIVSKELDLERLLKRLRMSTVAMLTLLSPD